MKVRLWALICALALQLAACGGGGSGGGSSSSSSANNNSGFDNSAFVGNWKTDSARCYSFDEYNESYFGRTESIEFTPTQLNMSTSIYSDVACTTKLGTLVFTFDTTYTQASLDGYPIAAKVKLTFKAFNQSAEAEQTLTLTKTPSSPDADRKVLLAIKNGMLYGSDSDADDYPTTVDSNSFLIKHNE